MDYSNNECYITHDQSIKFYYIFKTWIFFQITHYIYSLSSNLISIYRTKNIYDMPEVIFSSILFIIGNYILLINPFIFRFYVFIMMILYIISNILLSINIMYSINDIYEDVINRFYPTNTNDTNYTNNKNYKEINNDILNYCVDNDIIYNNFNLICYIYIFYNINMFYE